MDSKFFRVRQNQFWSAESLFGRAGFQSNALEEISSGLKAILVGRKPILFSGEASRAVR
jgi:hypothetical protein